MLAPMFHVKHRGLICFWKGFHAYVLHGFESDKPFAAKLLCRFFEQHAIGFEADKQFGQAGCYHPCRPCNNRQTQQR